MHLTGCKSRSANNGMADTFAVFAKAKLSSLRSAFDVTLCNLQHFKSASSTLPSCTKSAFCAFQNVSLHARTQARTFES